MTRGFVITVDAVLAAVILFTLLTISFDTLKRDGVDIQVQRELGVLSYKIGEALETSGALSNAALSNNTSQIRSFLDGLPFNMCASVSVKSEPHSTQTVFLVSKSGCSSIIGQSMSTSRGFVVPSPPDANLYVATISTWVNQGS